MLLKKQPKHGTGEQKGAKMSRVSDMKEFVEANEKMIGLLAELNNTDILMKSSIGILADTALRCLVLLAEIADMLERSEDGSETD